MKFLIIFAIIILFPKNAYAYLDPATGAMIINALVVGFITFMAFFRTQLKKALEWLGIKKDEDEETTDTPKTSEDDESEKT
jgi:multisubunit Na+/H+ antiporter MnhC subunit